jgi:PAS domain S-box-containing protein
MLGRAQVVAGLQGLRGTLVDRPDAVTEVDRLLQLIGAASKTEWNVYDLLAEAPLGIIIYRGPDHVIEFENLAHQRILGHAAEDNRGKPITEAYPEVPEVAIRHLSEVFLRGNVRTAEHVRLMVARSPGAPPQETFLRLALIPIKAADGSPWGIMSMSFDVTEVVRCQERLGEPYRSVVQQSSQLIWVTDVAGNAIFHNRAFIDFTGVPEETLLGTKGRCVMHPDDANDLTKARESSRQRGGPLRHEARLQRRDGVYIWHLLQIEPLKCERSNKQTGWIGFASDIQRVKELAEHAEAANRAKDEFLALLSHELRNPLAPMLTAVELIRLRTDGKITRELDVLERQVRHLTRLVEDLLDVSRITRQKITLQRKPLHVAEVVATSIEMASPLLEQRHQRLSVEISPQAATISGDPARLAQVFSNLLSNAAKYTPPRGQISLTVEAADSEVVVRVRDTGDGIAPELAPRLFDLFSQGTRSLDRSQGGLGLGLAIARNLVELHGGSVSAHSDGPGRGSEFVVRLPRSMPNEPLAAGVVAAAFAPSNQSGQALRVLVVDDNHDAANMLAEALHDMGCQTETAFDGPSALEAAKQFRPRLVLLDLGLPVMDGYEVARHLRQDAELVPLKLVAVSGYGRASDKQMSVDAGFDEHLVKPVDIDKVRSLVVSCQTAIRSDSI